MSRLLQRRETGRPKRGEGFDPAAVRRAQRDPRLTVGRDPQNGYVYDELTHRVRFQGAATKKAFLAKIDITYEEHL